MRKDRPVSVLQNRAAEEFAVLEAVHTHGGIPVPRPFFADEPDDELGPGTLLVMERVSGSKAGEYFPDLAAPNEHRRTLGRQLATALAHLHAVPLEALAEDEPRRRCGRDPATITAAVEGMSSPRRCAQRTTHRGRPAGPPVAARPPG